MEGEDCRIINVSTIREAVVLNECTLKYMSCVAAHLHHSQIIEP